MMALIKKVILILGALLIISACASIQTGTDIQNDVIVVVVSILPQAYFVERIAGDLAEISVMVGSGDDPHSYEPSPNQMKMISQADVYLSIGVEFEDVWLPRFRSATPSLVVRDISVGVSRIPAEENSHNEHAGKMDPHIWLSTSRAKIISQNIATVLSEIDSQNAPIYRSNLDSLLQDIDDLDSQILTKLKPLSGRYFMAYHPAWGYFADDYDLKMLTIEEGGEEPGAESLSKTIDLALENHISLIILQKEFTGKNIQVIADEIGAQVIVLDPLSKDWINNMIEISDVLFEGIR